jgi:hypothetical protein
MQILVFHFNPIEKFPPAMNLLRVFENEIGSSVHITVFTTHPEKGYHYFVPANKNIQIRRIGALQAGDNVVMRYLNYFIYYFGTFVSSLFLHPDKLFYYETFSAFVPLLLKTYFFKRAALFIHYHEYLTIPEYKALHIGNFFHRMEKKMYPRAAWISHTNQYRMNMFSEDVNGTGLKNRHIFPNYPPAAWGLHNEKTGVHSPLRLVYAGSFGSTETLYATEILDWVKQQQGKATLDIYSFNLSQEISNYIKRLDCSFIGVHGNIDYYDLPAVLQNYDVGLILYKGTTKNFEYNAPNKLFEYLACGLDVWYPDKMKGIWEYDTACGSGKVVRLDFEALDKYSIEDLVSRKAGPATTINYTCEQASRELLHEIITTDN